MANNVRNQARPRWSNSELSSLTLWYNEGVPLEEIANRLQRSPASVTGVIANKRGTLNLSTSVRRTQRSGNPILEERKNQRQLIHHSVKHEDAFYALTSIIQLAPEFFQARILFASHDLAVVHTVYQSEFSSQQACLRWFDFALGNFKL